MNAQFRVGKYAVLAAVAVLLLMFTWPFYTVSTGFRGGCYNLRENHRNRRRRFGGLAAMEEVAKLQHSC